MTDERFAAAVAQVVADHAATIITTAADDASKALEQQEQLVDMRRSPAYRAGWIDCLAHLRAYAESMTGEEQPDP